MPNNQVPNDLKKQEKQREENSEKKSMDFNSESFNCENCDFDLIIEIFSNFKKQIVCLKSKINLVEDKLEIQKKEIENLTINK